MPCWFSWRVVTVVCTIHARGIFRAGAFRAGTVFDALEQRCRPKTKLSVKVTEYQGGNAVEDLFGWVIASLLIVVPMWRICGRAGFSPVLGLLSFIPWLGFLIVSAVSDQINRRIGGLNGLFLYPALDHYLAHADPDLGVRVHKMAFRSGPLSAQHLAPSDRLQAVLAGSLAALSLGCA